MHFNFTWLSLATTDSFERNRSDKASTEDFCLPYWCWAAWDTNGTQRRWWFILPVGTEEILLKSHFIAWAWPHWLINCSSPRRELGGGKGKNGRSWRQKMQGEFEKDWPSCPLWLEYRICTTPCLVLSCWHPLFLLLQSCPVILMGLSITVLTLSWGWTGDLGIAISTFFSWPQWLFYRCFDTRVCLFDFKF